MKQVLLLGVVAFAFAIGGATWVTAYLLPPPPPPAVDSATAVAAAVPARPPAGPPHGDPAAAPADTGERKGSPTDAGRAAARPPARAGSAPAGDSLPPNVKTVAKIMVAMKPKDAADILGRLSDLEVEQIFRQMNAKQVATLLAVLPGERAAILSRRLLEVTAAARNGAAP